MKTRLQNLQLQIHNLYRYGTEDTVMPLLLAAQGTLLDDMEEHFESTRDRAVVGLLQAEVSETHSLESVWFPTLAPQT